LTTACSLVYGIPMLYVGHRLNVSFLAQASNDNDDLLDFATPAADLALIREIKDELRLENMDNGQLLCSRKNRRYFEEVVAAERYIVLKYFTHGTPEATLRHLKRHILDQYLFPRKKRGRKKASR